MSDAGEAHERGLAAFLAPSRRARFLDALERPAARVKLRRQFYGYVDHLDPAATERLVMTTKHDGFVAEVLARLRAEGAPERCVVAPADGPAEEAPLADGVATLMWSGAGFVSCRPGALALYVGEDGSPVVLLRRG